MGNKLSVANMMVEDFDSVITSKKRKDTIEDLQQQLERSQDEIKKKNEILSKLRSQLEQGNGKILVPIEKIRPSDQCRKTFNEAVILKRVESLKREGQLDSLILIPLTDKADHYQLEDGEVTWRAAKHLVESGDSEEKWKNLEAVISPLVGNEKEIHRRTLLHHLHSEGLNSLDRAESLFRELNWSLDLEIHDDEIKVGESRSEVAIAKLKKVLRNLEYQFRKNEKADKILQKIVKVGREEQEKALEELELSNIQIETILILLDFQIDLKSFVANDLAMISLPLDVKQAIRENNLPCHQAKEVGKITAKNLNKEDDAVLAIRTKAINYVTEQALSVRQTRDYVHGLLDEYGSKRPKAKERIIEPYKEFKQKLSKLSVNKLTVKQLETLKKTMEQKMREIDSMLESQ